MSTSKKVSKKASKNKYFVYMLLCARNQIYTGITTNVERRYAQHVAGKGARFTRSAPPQKILFIESTKNRSSALKREAEIKKLSRNKKLELVKI